MSLAVEAPGVPLPVADGDELDRRTIADEGKDEVEQESRSEGSLRAHVGHRHEEARYAGALSSRRRYACL